MSDPGELPRGVYPVYNDDDPWTIATGLFAGRINVAEELGLFELGTTELFLSEMDATTTEEEKRKVAGRWDEYYGSWSRILQDAAVKKAVDHFKALNPDYDIPVEEL